MARSGSYFEFLTKPRGSAREHGVKSEESHVFKTLRSGFPCHPSCVAYDPVQRLLAVGTRKGSLCIFGQPGVERFCEHESEAEVLQMHFLINEGALVTACSDKKLHMWSLRQSHPVLVHSLTLESRAGITSSHLPFRGKWLYVGTAKGNVHVVVLENFAQSQYSVMWNDTGGSSHPGDVIHISENPFDEDKLLIGYESGRVMLWDIKARKPLHRHNCDQVLHSMVWQSSGDQVLCGLEDGTLCSWSTRDPSKRSCLHIPQGAESKGPVVKVDYRSCVSGESMVVFTGSSTEGSSGSHRSIFIVRGNSVSTTDMASDIVDFVTLTDSPYPGDLQKPFAVALLLEEELVMIDLRKESCPIMESPAALRLQQADVTFCLYHYPCSSDFLTPLISAGHTRAHQRSVSKQWPLRGGVPSLETPEFLEIILTGHSDGTVKIWDGSGGSLLLLAEVDAGAAFEPGEPPPSSPSADPSGWDGGDPLAVHRARLCCRSHTLCVALASAHVIVYRLCERETRAEIDVVDIGGPGKNEASDSGAVFDLLSPHRSVSPRGRTTAGSFSNDWTGFFSDNPSVRSGVLCQPAGYQVEAVIRVTGAGGASGAPSVSSVRLCSEHSLVAIGHSFGVTVVDFKHKCVLANFSMSVVLGGTEAPIKMGRESAAETESSLEEDSTKSPPASYSPRRLSHMIDKVMKSGKHSDHRCHKAERHPSMESAPDSEALSVSELCFGELSATAPPGCIWAATSRGTVAGLSLRTAAKGARRSSQPAVTLGQNRVKNLGSAVLFLALLDRDSRPLEPGGRSPCRGGPTAAAAPRRAQSASRPPPVECGGAPGGPGLVVACAERQLRVWGAAKASCKRSLADAELAVAAGAVDVAGETRLACLRVDGSVAVFELPALVTLLCASLVPALGLRVARTACFADGVRVLYMSSGGEVRRAVLAAAGAEAAAGGGDGGGARAEHGGDVFIPVPNPVATNKQFLKNLFKSWKFSQDKSELFGETVGNSGSGSNSSSSRSHHHHHHHNHHSASRPNSQPQPPPVCNGRSRNPARDAEPAGPGSQSLPTEEPSPFHRLLEGIAERAHSLQKTQNETSEMQDSARTLLHASQQIALKHQGRRYSHK